MGTAVRGNGRDAGHDQARGEAVPQIVPAEARDAGAFEHPGPGLAHIVQGPALAPGKDQRAAVSRARSRSTSSQRKAKSSPRRSPVLSESSTMGRR
jgi:hypothetical protein